MEIKIRLWCGKGNMVYVTLNQIFNKDIHGLCCHFKDTVKMLFTGWKDINGHDIYEGDIVTDKYGGKAKVVYLTGVLYSGLTLLDENDWENEYRDNISVADRAWTWSNLKIIGNIYEQ